MKTICFINHKGGVGKTTSAMNIGAALSRMNNKVLLIDMDPQANLTIGMGVPIPQNKTIYGALTGKYPLPVVKIGKRLDVVCSTADLSVAEMELSNEPGRESLLGQLIKPYYNEYDYVLIDCPPALGLLTLNALSTSQLAIIPVELASFSLVGMVRLFDVTEKVRARINPELKHRRILVTRTDKRQAVHRELSVHLQNQYKETIFKTEIRANVKIPESQLQRKDIFSFNERSHAATDYMNLCKEILKIQ
jgi:chromosome partitioning protein